MALIARWRFEPGAFATDSINGNTLTLSGSPAVDATWRVEGQSSGKFVSASNQYGYRADADLTAGFPCRNGDATPVTVFTFCGWVRMNTATAWRGILNKEHSLSIAFNDDLALYLGVWDGTSIRNRAHATVLVVDHVYFFAVGYRDSDSYMSVRLRDIHANVIGTDLETTPLDPWNGIQTTADPFYIGAQDGTVNRLDGNLDDIRCYSGEYLSAAQATQICRQSSGLAGKRLMMGG